MIKTDARIALFLGTSLTFSLAACGDDIPAPDFGSLAVNPTGPFASSGPSGGPFSPERHSVVIGAEDNPVRWRASANVDWVDVVPASGMASPDAPSAFSIVVGQGASALGPNNYSGEIVIENLDDDGDSVTMTVNLSVGMSTTIMTVTPTSAFSTGGDVGGPFAPGTQIYTLEASDGNLNWNASVDTDWVTLTPSAGSIPEDGRAGVTVGLSADTADFEEGLYEATITFTNASNPSDAPQTRTVSLEIKEPIEMIVRPEEDFATSGEEGGPFDPPRKNYRVIARGGEITWQATETIDWIDLNGTGGTLARDEEFLLRATVNQNAESLAQGRYSGLITLENLTNGAGNTTRQVRLTVALPPDPFDLVGPVDQTAAAPVSPTFEWSASLGATTYRLEIATEATFGNIVETVADIPGTTHTLANALAPGTTYYWRAIAVNSIDETTATNAPWSFTTGVPPGAFDLTAPADTATDVALAPAFTWTSSGAVDTWEITIATDAALTQVVDQAIDLTGPTYTPATPLASNTTHYWSVDAVNSVGRVTATNAPLSFTTGAAPDVFSQTAPADAATDVNVSPTLSWGASTGATSYRVQIASDNAFGTILVEESGINGTSYTVASPLAAGVLHFWRVYAVNAVGETLADNAPYSFTTINNPNAFSLMNPPNNATDVALTPGFTWTALQGATSYDVRVATDSGFASVVATETGITATSVTLSTTLNAQTQYYWQVTGNPGGVVAQNAPFAFTTVGNAPGAFTLSAPADAEAQPAFPLVLSWADAVGETGYDVEVATDSAFTNVIASGSVGADTTSWSIPTGQVTPGATHYWRVTATSGQGSTVASNAPFSFTVDYAARTYAQASAISEPALAVRTGGGAWVGARLGLAGSEGWAASVAANGTLGAQWSLGGGSTDRFTSVVGLADGGALLPGQTNSAGSGGQEGWLVRVTSTGTVGWQKVYGGVLSDAFWDATAVGTDFVAVGETASAGQGGTDAWVTRVGSNGLLSWSRTLGTAGDERARAVTTNGTGIVFAGEYAAASRDAWLVALDASGGLVWQNRYGGTSDDEANAIVRTSDNGFAVAGTTRSFGAGGTGEPWMFKVSSIGALQWQTRLPIAGAVTTSIHETTDNGLLVALRDPNTGSGALVVKLSSTGALVWARRYGTDARSDGAVEVGGQVWISTADATTSPASLGVVAVRANGAPVGASVAVSPTATATTAVATGVASAATTPVVADTPFTPANTAATTNQVAP